MAVKTAVFTAVFTAFHRRFLRLPATNYFDDFAFVDWASAAAGGQALAGKAMAAFGYPFSEEKHVAATPAFVFLGVTCDLACAMTHGFVELFVAPERVRALRADLQELMRRDRLCGGAAGSWG